MPVIRLGTALYAVYGFSSFLIPVFLIVSGMFCLDDRWSPQGLICLAISFIPFFTIAFAEHISRKIAVEDIGPVAVTKIIILMAIAILVAVMEYLTVLVLSTPALRKELKPKLQEYKEKTLTKAFSFIKKNKESFTLKFKKDVLEQDEDGSLIGQDAEQENAQAELKDAERAQQEGSPDPAEPADAVAPVQADRADGSAEKADDAQQAEDDRLFDEAEHEAGMQAERAVQDEDLLLDEDTAIEQAVARSIDAAVESMFDTDGSLLEAKDAAAQVSGSADGMSDTGSVSSTDRGQPRSGTGTGKR